jgi:hypothetical protein
LRKHLGDAGDGVAAAIDDTVEVDEQEEGHGLRMLDGSARRGAACGATARPAERPLLASIGA